jgi:hypothetical protein
LLENHGYQLSGGTKRPELDLTGCKYSSPLVFQRGREQSEGQRGIYLKNLPLIPLNKEGN